MPAGAAAAAPHLTWTEAPYEAGQAVNMELGGCRHRYHSAMCRTVQLGTPPQKLVDLATLVVEGFHVALEAIRPGAKCQAVEAAWRRVIARAGLEKPTRMGYSIGLNYPPDWGERTASMRPGDTTVLAPGMTFHLIPAMWFDDWGFILSETVLVTEAGSESLNDFPRQLFVKD